MGAKQPAGNTESAKVTCKEAAQLVRDGFMNLIHWRPSCQVNYKDPDNDLAIIRKDSEQ